MLKLKPHESYPSEKGRYLRGNDYSPVALAVILNTDEDKIPNEINNLVKIGVESGCALSGTVQTPNIGFEKIICNIIGNPNIRYLILSGPESAGHLTGEALKALFENGVDEKKKIKGTNALHPYLYNIPVEFIERFKVQVKLINLQFKDQELIKKAIWTCIQENPTDFMNYKLFDSGAFSEPLIEVNLTWSVTEPWIGPINDKEQEARQRALDLIERLKNKSK